MSIERSPTKIVPKPTKYYNDNQYYPTKKIQQFHENYGNSFGTEVFFPQSVTDHLIFPCDGSFGSTGKYPSNSFDCIDDHVSSDTSLPFDVNKHNCHRDSMDTAVDNLVHTAVTSSNEVKGLKIENCGKRFDKENETRFSLSSDCERKLLYYSLSEKMNVQQPTTVHQDEPKQRLCRIKGSRQKQLEDDDLDCDTRLYGKSPKFDDNMGNFGHFETNYRNYLSRSEPGRSSVHQGTSGYFFNFDETLLDDDQETLTTTTRNHDGIVFNTLDGFEINYMIHHHNESSEAMNSECTYSSSNKIIDQLRCKESIQDQYLRNNIDQKFSAGQIKRPLSQDEDVSSKSGRILEGPKVTPGDVGRMLNLGDALDGPRQQAQPNKYLSLVTMHLPVILRLSVNCPFENVRLKCTEILQMVKVSQFL